MRLCIIADDLTGALDAAAPFAGRGLSVQVALTPQATGRVAASGADVIAVSTQSRDGSEVAACAAMEQVLAALPSNIRLFKKVDSRLKGHVKAELAMLAPDRMLVAPAIPDFGRITKKGHVMGFGVDQPIDIRDQLGELAPRAAVPDVATSDQMHFAIKDLPSDTLLVGARGLAEALAIAMTGLEDAHAIRPRAKRALMVVGSRDPITLAQLASARNRATCVAAPLGDLVHPEEMAADPYLLVQATPGASPRTSAAVAQALARSVYPVLTQGREAILLTGGATAEAVLTEMKINVLDLRGECLPGLPVAFADGSCIIAKSGGFGDEQTLLTLLRIFQGSS